MPASLRDHSAPAPQASKADAPLQQALARLGPGWRWLNPTTSSTAAAATTGQNLPAVLANPAFGVILLDVAPRMSPAAVERFRAMLEKAEFHLRFPGNLPVVHRVLPAEHLGRLPDIIDYALSWEPPLTLRRDAAWVDMLRKLLTGVPVSAAVPADAAASGRMPVEQAAVDDNSAPGLGGSPAVLLLAGCALLVALGLGTKTLWRPMAPAPGGETQTLAAGDEVQLAAPMQSGGRSSEQAEPPATAPLPVSEPDVAVAEAAMPPSDSAKSSAGQAVETAPPRLEEQPQPGTSAPGSASQDETVPGPAGNDATPTLPVADTPLAKAPPIEPEAMPGPDGHTAGTALPGPSDAAAAVVPEAAPALDGPVLAEQPPPANGPVASSAPIPTDNTGNTPPEAEVAAAVPTIRPEQPGPVPVPQEDATSRASPTAPAESGVAEPSMGTAAARPTNPPRPSDALLSTMLRRGDSMLALGDVSAARLFYERAAAAGSGQAATALGKTYDPAVLAKLGVRGIAGDVATAIRWYRAALARGDAEAGPLIERIERLPP